MHVWPCDKRLDRAHLAPPMLRSAKPLVETWMSDPFLEWCLRPWPTP